MKTIRYILSIFLFMMGIGFAQAQSNNPLPEYEFQSTSAMVGSGSSLPQAAIDGASTTYDCSSPQSGSGKNGPRKVSPGSNTGDPGATPIGNGIWVLLLFACCYAGIKLLTTKKENL